MKVEVVYALALVQHVVTLEMPDGATVQDALRCSGLPERMPEITRYQLRVGIWGKEAKLSDPLRDQDRVEIYRPLIADPKEARRRRAAGKSRTSTKHRPEGSVPPKDS